tara:strand:- start:441 stop:557 length:117 start_codon:yes stop_codon:yes gene_type:complete
MKIWYNRLMYNEGILLFATIAIMIIGTLTLNIIIGAFL